MTYELEIFADYFQIYLEDENSNIDVSDSFSEPLSDRVVFDPTTRNGFVLITARNMTVPLEIGVLEQNPLNDNFVNWDHVIECSIELPSGRLMIMGCTDYRPDALRIPLKPTTYRARLYYGKLDTLINNGLDGDDHYRIDLWEEAFKLPKVLK